MCIKFLYIYYFTAPNLVNCPRMVGMWTHFPSQHDISGSLDAIHQTLSTSIQIVKLALHEKNVYIYISLHCTKAIGTFHSTCKLTVSEKMCVRQTHRHTHIHKLSTITLAVHACRGLCSMECLLTVQG